MLELKDEYTIAVIIHNMLQGIRVADVTASFPSTLLNMGGPVICNKFTVSSVEIAAK
jgi:ABC-type phosphate transport system ATPase subunit